MRRTVTLGAIALVIMPFGAPSAADPGSQGAFFTVACPGISASGHEAGWGAAMLVESGTGVSVGSAAHLWSGTQGTWVNPKKIPATGRPDYYGSWSSAGEHPGAVSAYTGTLDWYFLGDRYWARIYDLEVTFTPVS